MKSIVITFGRMNPPTVGHQKLVQKVQTTARVNSADSRIYLSHTQNNKKDPLTYDEKISLARAAFGNIVVKSNAKTIIEVSKELEASGYTDLILVVGSDRIAEFDKLLNKYNGSEYKFNSIKVVSAGERDPDAEGVEGMSASKLRKLALAGDYETFSKGLPSKVSEKMKKQTYDKIRSVIKEETETDYCFECMEDPCACGGNHIEEDRAPLTIQQRMKRSRTFKRLQPKLQRFKKLRAKRMADEPRIKKKANKAAIAIMRRKVAGERGKDYANLPVSDKIAIDRLISKKTAMIAKLAKRLIPKIRKQELERVKKARQATNEAYEVAQDKTIGSKPGTQPKKYYSGLSKSEKEARNAQFKRGAEKDSSDPSAYPDKHAGDAGVKTKPSKYTKKYKDMFGEKTEVSKAREAIRAEKEDDKKKFDSLLDRARATDARKKNMTSTVEEFEINESAEAALRKKAEKSGISYGTLKKVYDRGMAAWRTGHRPGATQQQWAFARVNSYITKGKTYHTADSDLREEEDERLDELSSKMLDRYGKKATKDAWRQIMKGNFAKGDKRLSGVVKASEKNKMKEEVAEASDISGLTTAAKMVKDYIVTAEVDGKIKKFRVRGMTGPNAARERFMRHASMAKVKDVKLAEEVEGVAEETIHVGYRNSRGVWIKTSTHSNYPDADKAMKELEKSGKKGVQHRYDNKGNIDPGMRKLAHEEVEGVESLLEYPSDLAKMKKADSYKVGDKIYTRVGGAWRKGHITTPLNKAGNHGVKFQHNGKTHSYVSHPDDLRLHVEEVEDVAESAGNLKPGWMLKKDPELAKKLKDKVDLAKKRQASYGDQSKGVSVKEEGGAGEEGTDKLVSKYKKDTPFAEDAGSMKHHQFQKTFKHALQHAKKHIDKDVDGDVDNLDDNPYVPDEATGTEKKDLTPKFFSKFRKEKQHTKKGDAFEELELDEISSELAGRYAQKATQDQIKKKGLSGALRDKTSKRAKGIDRAYDRVLKTEESEQVEESMADSWKRVQSMDKGSIIGGKEEARKRLAYLNAVHAHHKKYGNDTKKVKGEIERINRSRIAEETCCDDCDKYFDHIVEEAEHEGRKVKLNDPFRTPSGPKKFSVYVKNDKGNVVKVNFGDPNMEIKRDDPDRRKNFRARHNCDNPGPKWKARYWSCYQWRSGAKVDS